MLSDLKAAKMNMQRNLIQEIMVYEFKLGQNAEEVNQNICCAKGEGLVDHSTVIRCFEKFCHDRARLRRPKNVESEAVF